MKKHSDLMIFFEFIDLLLKKTLRYNKVLEYVPSIATATSFASVSVK